MVPRRGKWYPRQELNLDQQLRRLLRYPLRNGGTTIESCRTGTCCRPGVLWYDKSAFIVNYFEPPFPEFVQIKN